MELATLQRVYGAAIIGQVETAIKGLLNTYSNSIIKAYSEQSGVQVKIGVILAPNKDKQDVIDCKAGITFIASRIGDQVTFELDLAQMQLFEGGDDRG